MIVFLEMILRFLGI